MAVGLLIAIAVLVLARCSSPAATVGPERVYGSRSIVFRAVPGETNRLKVSLVRGYPSFTDTGNRVMAQGRCEQVNVHTVRCPLRVATWVRLGDGSDRARLDLSGVIVRGGTGDDALRGGANEDYMVGGAGNDMLRGRGGDDQLTGAPGRDRIYGGRGDDLLSDGETDAQAAIDRFDGGPQARTRNIDSGDTLNYFERRAGLTIDLAAGVTSSEDAFVDMESVLGGRGDDELSGDGHENSLAGGRGADVIYGRGGHDIVSGGGGDDRVFGDEGDDVLWGHGGADALSGGVGNDSLFSAEEDGRPRADVLACDAGADSARSDSLDTITAECETVTPNPDMRLRSVPSIDGHSADFTLNCSGYPGCSGTISLYGPDGEPYGSAAFAITVIGDSAEAVVAVPLNAVALTALQVGTLVQVHVIFHDGTGDSGGYRIFLRTGQLALG